MPRTRFHAQLVIRHIGRHIGRHIERRIVRPQSRLRRRASAHTDLRARVTTRHLVLCKPRRLERRSGVSAGRVWLGPLTKVRQLDGSPHFGRGKF